MAKDHCAFHNPDNAEESRTFRGKLIINSGIAFAVTMLVIIGWSTYRSILTERESDRRQEHTHIVILHFEELLSAVRDVATEQQGYLITGNKKYLESYNNAIGQVNQKLLALKTLTQDNSQQHKQREQIESLIRVKLVELKATIDLRRDKGFAAVQQAAAADTGKGLMGSILAAIESAQKEDLALLKNRDETKTAFTHKTIVVISTAGGLGFVFLITSFVLLKRTGRELAMHRDNLAGLVEERANDLEKANAMLKTETAELVLAQEAKNRLAAIVESSDDAILSKSLDGTIKTWNGAAQQMFGYRSEEIIGQPITTLIPHNRLHEEEQILERLAMGERIEHYETLRATKDGRQLDVSVTISPIKDRNGEVVGASTIVRDITARKRVEEQLRQQQESFRVTLGSIGDAVIACDADKRVSYLNVVAESLTGWKLDEAKGTSINEVFNIVSEATHMPAADIAAQVLRDKCIVGLANHTSIITKDGQEIPIEDSAAPILDADGNVNGVVIVFHDVTERRRAHDALQKTLEQFQMAMDSGGLGAWDYRLDTREVFWDDRCRDMHGLVSGNQPDYTTIMSTIHVDDRDAIDRAVQDAISGKTNGDYYREYRVIWPDKSVHWVASRGRVYFAGQGPQRKAFRFNGVNMEITRQKEAEKNLQLYEILARFSHDIILFVRREDGRIVEANEAAVAEYGYRRDELLSMTVKQLRAPEAIELTDSQLSHADQNGAFFETTHCRKDGTKMLVEVGSRGITIDGERILLSVIRDVTARKAAEQILRDNENRIRLKLDSILSPEGDIGNLELAEIIDEQIIQTMMDNFFKLARVPMSIIDLKGKMLVGVGWQDICTKFHRVNAVTCKHCIESDTQLTADVAPGEFKLYKCKNNMWDIATPIMIGDRKVGNLFVGQFLFEDEQHDYEFFRSQARQYGFDEKEYIAALDRVPRLSRDAVNTAMGFFLKLAATLSKLSYSNIKLARTLAQGDMLMNSLRYNQEQLLKAQTELEAQNHDLEAIISFISHDLRTPLVNIKGFSGELKRDCTSLRQLLHTIHVPAEHQEQLTKICDKYIPESIGFIQTSAEFMNNIVSSLIQVARVGITAVDPETLEMNQILKTVTTTLETKIKGAGMQISIQKLPCCRADQVQITQAFANLLDNAIKYRNPSRPGQVRVSAQVDGESVVYCVEDNGIGIAARHYDEIFEMFFRLHDKVVGGEGIGLCMVKRMIDRNGGRIWVTSEEGKGSKFFVALPKA